MQIPPIPQEHATQFGPYSFAPHCVHVLALTDVPVGHELTHVELAAYKRRGEVHVTHVDAVVTHVAQLVLQVRHTLLALAYVPDGQLLTHVEPLRYLSDDAELHVLHALDPDAKHVKHDESHARQV